MQANSLINDLQDQLAKSQSARVVDRARLKFAAQVLLAQGAGEKSFQQELSHEAAKASSQQSFTY